MDWKVVLEPHILAVVVTLLAVWSVTEIAKRSARKLFSFDNYWFPRGTALLTGMLVGGMSWPKDTEVEPILFGGVIGVSAALIHHMFLSILKWKWPDLASKISGTEKEEPS